MTSFYKLTVGEQVELQRVLSEAGMTTELARRVIAEPGAAQRMIAAVRGDPRGILLATAHQSYALASPTWWRTPEQQLERARQLWPNTVLPEPPKEFTPRTKSEVLLLHVSDSFDSLWGKVVAPTGYTKYRWEGVKADEQNLRLSPNKREYTEPVWLVFDPERGKGARPDSFWGQADVAASEVLSALIQFPDWSLSWFNGASAPNLAGYQLKYDENWSSVPCHNLWDDGHRLELSAYLAACDRSRCASPSVREC